MDLEPLASEVAGQLQAWLAGRTPGEIHAGALADDYGSLTWAILNLWQRGVDDGDAALIAFSRQFTKEHFLPLDVECPLAADDQDDAGFFPPCLHRARAVLEVLPEEDRPGWAEAFVPTTPTLAPIGAPTIPHVSGLNFSRSWGLWSIYQRTGAVAYRDSYIAHIEKHMAQPEYWDARYEKYSHWVAQFGVYGIALSFEPPPE